MIGQLTAWILDAIRANGGWSVFLGVMIEQVIIPIPSPAIIMGAGAILVPAGAGAPEAFLRMTVSIVLPGVVASTLGAILLYYIGRWSGKAFVDRFQNYLGFSWRDVEWMGQKISTTGEAATVFFSRAVPVIPLSLISLVGGVLEMKLGTFVLWTVLGSIPRCYLLGYLGWKLGGGALNWAKGVNKFESIVSLAIVGAVAAGILYLRKKIRGQMGAGGPEAK